MKSNISGTSVTIGGVVLGNVIASEKIIILSTGLVLGDIITREIKADEGALINGRVITCRTEQSWQLAIASYNDERAISEALVKHGA
jgi:cytoskeletal protein CcmA (bactofilin family)